MGRTAPQGKSPIGPSPSSRLATQHSGATVQGPRPGSSGAGLSASPQPGQLAKGPPGPDEHLWPFRDRTDIIESSWFRWQSLGTPSEPIPPVTGQSPGFPWPGRMAKQADARDLKSRILHRVCGFDPRSGHWFYVPFQPAVPGHCGPVTSCVTSCKLVIDWHCTMPPVLDRLTWVREQRGTPHHLAGRSIIQSPTPGPSRDHSAPQSPSGTAGTGADSGNRPQGRACSSRWKTPVHRSPPRDDGDPNSPLRPPVAADW